MISFQIDATQLRAALSLSVDNEPILASVGSDLASAQRLSRGRTVSKCRLTEAESFDDCRPNIEPFRGKARGGCATWLSRESVACAF